GGFEKLGGALARFPLDDDVIGNVGEQEALAGFVPDRSFGPDKTLGNLLQLSVPGNQLVETRIEPFDGANDLPGFTLRGRLFLLLSQGELGGETGGQGRDRKEVLPHDEFSKKTQELTNSRCVDLQHQPEALARPSLTLRVSGLPNHARSVRAPYRNVQCVAVMAIYVEGGFRQSSVSRAAPWPTGL